MRIILPLLVSLVLWGCSTVGSLIDEQTFYRRDLSFMVNQTKCNGACIAKQAASYEIKAELDEGNFDFLIIRSCHREYTAEKQGDEFKFIYVPIVGLEDNRACPLEIRGFDKSKGKDVFGFIDFESSRDTLSARMDCNGKTSGVGGTSVCQSAQGLIQRILFPAEVYSEAVSPGCKIVEPKDLRTFEFKQPARQCLIKFMEKAEPHRTHRLMTLGYGEVLPRKF